jgi:predicted O-methyltransferase YrrM
MTDETPRDLAVRFRERSRAARHALGDPRAAVNLRWLRALTGAPSDHLLDLAAEYDTLVPVEEEIHRRHLAGGRDSYAQIAAPLELYSFVRLLRPQHIVETGVSSGVSSAHFLLALDKNRAGTLHSIDFPTTQRGPVLAKDESPVSLPPGLSTGWAVPFRSPRWDLRSGEAERLLPALVDELPHVDLFLHDDRHTPEQLALELSTLRPKLSPGALVLADNTNWTGEAFPRFAREVRARVYRRGSTALVGLRMPVPRTASTTAASAG